MRGSFCYMPILPARYGVFRAMAVLSSLARSRTAPMFDVPNIILKPAETLESYLLKRVDGIYGAWAADRPCYVDAYGIPIDWRLSSGEICIEFIIRRLRERGARVIPVTGTVADRGRDYLHALRSIAEAQGVCLRIGRDEFAEPKRLLESLQESLDTVGVSPAQIDVVADFRFIGDQNLDLLRAAALDALNLLFRFGTFRNVMIAGSSVPPLLPKRDEGRVRREPRRDFELWAELCRLIPANIALPLCAYSVVGANYVPPGKPVNTPARVRYTTPTEHIFLRGKRDEHSKVSRQLLEVHDAFCGPTYSIGDQRLYQSANGQLGKGTCGDVGWIRRKSPRRIGVRSGMAVY